MTKGAVSALSKKLIIPAGLCAILLGMTGGQWDAWRHVKQGHELLAIPHLIIIVGLILFTLSGFLAFFILALEGRQLPATKRRGLWLAMLGGSVLPFALVLDEAWHRFFGLEQTAWSAPHAIMFSGVAAVLLGISMFVSDKTKILTVIFFATILLLGLFSLSDFDEPHMAWVSNIRPGFTYPITLSGITTFVFLLVGVVTKRPGSASVAAILAWGFHAGTANIIGAIGGFTHTVLPFPIIVPALVFDIALLISLNTTEQKFCFGFRSKLLIALVTASVCYITTVAWSALYTIADAPQQLSGGPIDWALWYIFVPFIALVTAWLAHRFSKWARVE